MKEEKIIEKARTLLDSGKYEKLVKASHVAVIGAGGAGCNMVTRMMEALNGMEGVDTILINSDSRHLMSSGPARKKVLIGNGMGDGKGARGSRSMARKMVDNARESLEVLIKPYQLVVLVGALGGGTGTELMIQLSRMAVESGKVAVAMPILPFSAESRRAHAIRALDELKSTGAATIPMDNQTTLERLGSSVTLEDAFSIQARIMQKKIGELNASVRREIMNEILRDIEEQIKAEEAMEAVVPMEVTISMSVDEPSSQPIPEVTIGMDVVTASEAPEIMKISEKEEELPPGAS
jgi:cell division GTPase FtsZ